MILMPFIVDFSLTNFAHQHLKFLKLWLSIMLSTYSVLYNFVEITRIYR